MNNNMNTATSIDCMLTQNVLSKIKIKRKFEIFIEEYDEEGGPGHTPIWKPVKMNSELGGGGQNPVIVIESQQDLREKQQFYTQLGQRFKIIREIDPPSQDTLYKAAVEQGLISNSDCHAAETRDTDVNDQPRMSNNSGINANRPMLENNGVSASDTNERRTDALTKKPKIVTIGDIQIKYDGDRVYQKQWIRLSQKELENFRIVSDSTNKLFPLAGKHIEAKRWVLIEEHDMSDEEDLNA